jgi:surface protein
MRCQQCEEYERYILFFVVPTASINHLTRGMSKVTTMEHMFSKVSNFDQPLDAWDVSNATDMSLIFHQVINR